MGLLLRVDSVKKFFRKKIALNGVSFDLKEGEVFSLLGVNGAGKTTLSSIIVSLSPASSGDIIFKGKSIYDDITEYRRYVGYCPQHPNLNMLLSIKDNLIMAGRYYCMNEDEIQKRYKELIKQFELSEYENELPNVLSGGYKRRVLIARSLMHNPSLVVLDEPTVGLDPQIRHELWKFIRNFKTAGITVLLTTHYLDEAEQLSDRVCLLDKGEIILINTPDKLKEEYKKERLEDVFLHLVRAPVSE